MRDRSSHSGARRRPGLPALVVLLALLAAATPTGAVDSEPKTDPPDLALARQHIKAKDFAAALVELNRALNDGVQHADLHNLLGFAHRKSGDMRAAATFYAKALDFDANHKGALEYQGEMFVELGQLDRARANLARLAAICPDGCEEREDLEKAIAGGTGSGRK